MWRVLSPAIDYLTAHPYLFFVGFLLYVFIFALSVLMNGRKPGPNPFARSSVKPPQPVVTDQNARDKVLKQGFSPQKVPEELDAVVVGSGIGGLTAAVLLAKAGKKVLVLEQLDQAGGCCHTFIEKGFEFDVGIHYVGEMKGTTVLHCMSQFLTDGQLVWESAGPVYDQVAIGDPNKAKRYPLRVGRQELYDSILSRFPEEKPAVDKFFKLLKSCQKSMLMFILLKTLPRLLATILVKTGLVHLLSNFFKYSSQPLKSTIDSLTDNEELKVVLTYCFGDYGTVPHKVGFAMHAMLFNHFTKGSYYPRGGASEIAYHMVPIVERSGGRVLVRAPVSQILFCEKGRARGVRVKKGDNEYDIYARTVISAAGVLTTVTKFLPKEIVEKSVLSRVIKRVENGTACISLFIGLNGSTEELKLPTYNTWAFVKTGLGEATEEYLALTAEEAAQSDVPLLFIGFPSAKDSNAAERSPGKSTCTVITLARWEWFAKWQDGRVKKRGEDYEAIKAGIGRQMWRQTTALYPQLEDKVEYMEVGSPLSNNYYLGSNYGEIYGLDHSMARFTPENVLNLRPDTDIPGLYLAGQDVFTCGYGGGMLGGIMGAGAVLHRNLLIDALSYKKAQSKLAKSKNN